MAKEVKEKKVSKKVVVKKVAKKKVITADQAKKMIDNTNSPTVKRQLTQEFKSKGIL